MSKVVPTDAIPNYGKTEYKRNLTVLLVYNQLKRVMKFKMIKMKLVLCLHLHLPIYLKDTKTWD